MKISELINDLERAKEKYGDMKVGFSNDDEIDDPPVDILYSYNSYCDNFLIEKRLNSFYSDAEEVIVIAGCSSY